MRRRRAKTWEWASAVAGQGDAPSMQRSSRRLSRSQRRRGARAPPHPFHPPRPRLYARCAAEASPFESCSKRRALLRPCAQTPPGGTLTAPPRVIGSILSDERDMLRTREELEEIEARTLA